MHTETRRPTPSGRESMGRKNTNKERDPDEGWEPIKLDRNSEQIGHEEVTDEPLAVGHRMATDDEPIQLQEKVDIVRGTPYRRGKVPLKQAGDRDLLFAKDEDVVRLNKPKEEKGAIPMTKKGRKIVEKRVELHQPAVELELDEKEGEEEVTEPNPEDELAGISEEVDLEGVDIPHEPKTEPLEATQKEAPLSLTKTEKVAPIPKEKRRLTEVEKDIYDGEIQLEKLFARYAISDGDKKIIRSTKIAEKIERRSRALSQNRLNANRYKLVIEPALQSLLPQTTGFIDRAKRFFTQSREEKKEYKALKNLLDKVKTSNKRVSGK